MNDRVQYQLSLSDLLNVLSDSQLKSTMVVVSAPSDNAAPLPVSKKEPARRQPALRKAARSQNKQDIIRLGDTVISFDAATITREGQVRTLTAKEYVILEILAENRGKIVPIDAICDALWPEGSYGMENSLLVHIRNIRKKIEPNPSKPQYLVTVRGLGYKLQ